MRSNFNNRLNKIEKGIEKKLNPMSDKGDIIIFLPDKGETPEQKLAERERQLGYKLNRSKVLFFRVRGIDRI